MKNFLKMLANRRWEVRYKNLEKKYNALLLEHEDLKKKLDDNYLEKIIKNKNAQIKRQKEIIGNLREDYKKATSKKNDYELR